MNSNGATIYNTKIIGTTTMQINSKNWPAGLYIVELWQNNKLVFSKKVVKE
jgi:hypothetical protein